MSPKDPASFPKGAGPTGQAGGAYQKKKIIVAMSGGVDSSVAAALLKRAGFDVRGAFLKLYDSPQFKESEKKAKKIAEILGIPFLNLDLRKEFKKKVVDYFLREYQRGRTPNPCVKCNQEIKFGIFFKKALNLGADYIATGHYARIKNACPPKPAASGADRRAKLLVAKDKEKDQSYFLYNLAQKQLKKILFPIGNYTKAKVKKLAKGFGIADLVRPESRDICFLKGTTPLPPPSRRRRAPTYRDFFKKYLKLKPGPILNTSGKRIGQHQGLPLYTIGQRKEIEVPGVLPCYVLKLDFKNNTLVVTDNEKDLYKKELVAEKVNWVSRKAPKLPLKIKAKIRYLHPANSATIRKQETGNKKQNLILVKFSKSQRAITPGQSVVFYLPRSSPKVMVWGRGQEVLGGGIIR